MCQLRNLPFPAMISLLVSFSFQIMCRFPKRKHDPNSIEISLNSVKAEQKSTHIHTFLMHTHTECSFSLRQLIKHQQTVPIYRLFYLIKLYYKTVTTQLPDQSGIEMVDSCASAEWSVIGLQLNHCSVFGPFLCTNKCTVIRILFFVPCTNLQRLGVPHGIDSFNLIINLALRTDTKHRL